MRVCLLGAGLIGMFYTMSLHGKRGRDRVSVVYSRTQKSADQFAKQWEIPVATNDMLAAIERDDIDVVIVALPNHLHKSAVVKSLRWFPALFQRIEHIGKHINIA